ncbi:MAG: hypothetical protein DI563_02880 [Variovorax paradoxus]|uniref:RelB antitoxin n=1 Tax=Variovorax paradoxus TaxID=34073 RepID=A0A2W5QL90_VARPD|nr:MAG: hypothetical protein DI563_02880 [Variovorax paradoxus]
MDAHHLRIRIERDIADKAMAMARERGLELADVMRMWLTKAVLTGDFAIDLNQPAPAPAGETRAFFAYDESPWAPLKEVLDGELALALVNQFVANQTIEIERLMDINPPDTARIRELRRQRDVARQVLSTFDPEDPDATRTVIERFAAKRPPLQDRTRRASDDEETS